jgi:hypothetical protein
LEIGTGQSRRMASPRVFYFCYSHQRPRGGQKETYEHVDILNDHGWEAYALHLTEEFRLNWFSNETRTIGPVAFEHTFDVQQDFLVLPEDLGWRMKQFQGQKVVFNKGLGLGFQAFGATMESDYPYLDPDVRAAFVMSAHNAEHLAYAFPHLPVFRMYSGIDQQRFVYRSPLCKKRVIAIVDKAPELTLSLYHIVRARGAAGHNVASAFSWVFIKDLSECDVAALLQDALLIVFASVSEGGPPRTVLEAMACGCIVATCGVGPILEALPNYALHAPGDLLGVARFIEDVIAAFPADASTLVPMAEAGRDIAHLHSRNRQRDGVLRAWEALVEGPAA